MAIDLCRASHLRTLSTVALLAEAVALMEEHHSSTSQQQPPTLLFAGDLNSDRNWGIPGASCYSSTALLVAQPLSMCWCCTCSCAQQASSTRQQRPQT